MSIRMRNTSGHTGNRRSHHSLKATKVIVDKESGNLRLPHHLDEATGMYRGHQIAAPRAPRVSKDKTKVASIEPSAEHTHEHAHEEHANAAVKGAEGVVGKVKHESRSEVKSKSPKSK